MVQHPGCVVELHSAERDNVQVVDDDTGDASVQQIVSQVTETLDACRSAWPAAGQGAHCQVRVCRSIPTHAGFGSGTQLRLAIARGWRLVHGFDAGTPVELARVCGRGRRSAIGLWGFEWGGFLIDAGQREQGAMGELAARTELLDSWRVLMMTLQRDERISGNREECWMSQLSPMPMEQSGELCRLALTEILPAVRSGQIEEFRAGLQSYGDIVGNYFAQVQGGRFSHPEAAEIVEHMQRRGIAGVVQSSWGPTLCAFFDDEASAVEVQDHLAGQFPGMTFAISPARNYGADIELR